MWDMRLSVKGVCALVLIAAAAGGEPGARGAPEPPDVLAELFEPFWASGTMRNETVMFKERDAGQPGSARLLFPPEKILSIASATGETVYEEGRDFTAGEGGVLRVTPKSRIAVTTRSELYKPKAKAGRKDWGPKRGDPGTVLARWDFDPHLRQAAVTYTHAKGLWKGPVPEFAGEKLPRTIGKLKAGGPVRLMVVGDSISVGHAATCMRRDRKPPGRPAYFTQVAMGLRKAYGAKVRVTNISGNGRIAGWGTSQIERLRKRGRDLGKPDLAVIAFGMNDWCRGRTAEQFAARVAGDMDKVRELAAEAEFILVSPMLPWPEWSAPNPKCFETYPAALSELAAKEGAAFVNMTAVWAELLKRKDFHDIGDPLNHPNDFGHKVYAQMILGVLVERFGAPSGAEAEGGQRQAPATMPSAYARPTPGRGRVDGGGSCR